MLGIPSRAALTAFMQAVREVAPLHSVGFVRIVDDARVAMLIAHPNGVSESAVGDRAPGIAARSLDLACVQ
jgi:hypothetical protein